MRTPKTGCPWFVDASLPSGNRLGLPVPIAALENYWLATLSVIRLYLPAYLPTTPRTLCNAIMLPLASTSLTLPFRQPPSHGVSPYSAIPSAGVFRPTVVDKGWPIESNRIKAP